MTKSKESPPHKKLIESNCLTRSMDVTPPPPKGQIIVTQVPMVEEEENRQGMLASKDMFRSMATPFDKNDSTLFSAQPSEFKKARAHFSELSFSTTELPAPKK
eukprot:Blabericola_migrator_1__1657@NODE_1445_length_4532_cov_230_960806_g958_i0_p8_GENE_NODE_1445_length_4532_cov_230_960806_g958_i0NODE_1445_length_4532_cov_230_960806_g958_i0_p8_ORF_typecomplete_len103_score21_09_NODE_1445_length_4532_cov_230_960806_g958_i032123520